MTPRAYLHRTTPGEYNPLLVIRPSDTDLLIIAAIRESLTPPAGDTAVIRAALHAWEDIHLAPLTQQDPPRDAEPWETAAIESPGWKWAGGYREQTPRQAGPEPEPPNPAPENPATQKPDEIYIAWG